MMTKQDLEQYRHKIKERDQIQKRIHHLEEKARNVPTIKDKVQASMKDYPYTPTHITVDAPESKQYTAIQRTLYLLRLKEVELYEELLRLDNFILSIEDSRTRQIFMARYVDGIQLKDVAIRFDMTEQGILKIINKILDEFN